MYTLTRYNTPPHLIYIHIMLFSKNIQLKTLSLTVTNRFSALDYKFFYSLSHSRKLNVLWSVIELQSLMLEGRLYQSSHLLVSFTL